MRVSDTKLVKITLPFFKILTAADLSRKDDFDQLFNFQGPVISECTIVDLHAQRHGFRPTEKEPFPRSEFTLVLNLDILDAGRSPNVVRDHAGTTQVDFEVDRPPPADSPPGDLLITTVKETVIL